jgi:hypothetical protein
MKYITIFDTPKQNQVTIISHLFKENQIDYRILNEATNNAIPVGKSVQVMDNQVEKAKNILKENGFYGTLEPKPTSEVNYRFLWYLFFALLLIVVISALINWYLF